MSAAARRTLGDAWFEVWGRIERRTLALEDHPLIGCKESTVKSFHPCEIGRHLGQSPTGCAFAGRRRRLAQKFLHQVSGSRRRRPVPQDPVHPANTPP